MALCVAVSGVVGGTIVYTLWFFVRQNNSYSEFDFDIFCIGVICAMYRKLEAIAWCRSCGGGFEEGVRPERFAQHFVVS